MVRAAARSAPAHQDSSPERTDFERTVQRRMLRLIRSGADHWLLLVNAAAGALFALPVLIAPALEALGLHGPAQLIFWAYGSQCHQMPSRSFYLWGEQMALCHRMSAIYGSCFLFGMSYIMLRRRLGALPFWLLAAYSFPMAVDGFTQLFGWRESNWELRLLSGAFFALGTVWYIFPRVELVMRVFRHQLDAEIQQLTPTASHTRAPA